MLLIQYKTFPLEGKNSIMKNKATKMVRPNMMLLDLAKMQNVVQQSRIYIDLQKMLRLITSTLLWLSSETAGKVDTYCESQLK